MEYSIKELRFIDIVVSQTADGSNGNVTQAAIQAGYSESSATQIGSELMRKPKIKRAIQKKLNKELKKYNVTTYSVLRKLAAIAHCDVDGFFNPDGTMKTMAELDSFTKDGISRIEVVHKQGKDGPYVEQKIILIDNKERLKALELLGKYLSLFNGNGTDPDLEDEVDNDSKALAKREQLLIEMKANANLYRIDDSHNESTKDGGLRED